MQESNPVLADRPVLQTRLTTISRHLPVISVFLVIPSNVSHPLLTTRHMGHLELLDVLFPNSTLLFLELVYKKLKPSFLFLGNSSVTDIHLLSICINFILRKMQDFNPRTLARSPLFKSGAIKRSANLPLFLLQFIFKNKCCPISISSNSSYFWFNPLFLISF